MVAPCSLFPPFCCSPPRPPARLALTAATSGHTFAVIGDIPYGEPAAEAFPAVVDRINADRDVELVAHLGDIKSGSTLCNDEYFAFVRSQFDRFADPLPLPPRGPNAAERS